MATIKLTQKELDTIEALKKGSILRGHKTLTDTHCYRLLDDNKNPIRNFPQKDIKKLVDCGALTIEGERFTLSKVTDKHIQTNS